MKKEKTKSEEWGVYLNRKEVNKLLLRFPNYNDTIGFEGIKVKAFIPPEVFRQLLKQEQTRRKEALLKQAEAFEFILKQEKEKLLERIKLEKKKVEYRAVPEGIEVDSEKNEGYNQAIADLEKLKEEIKEEK